MKLAKEKEIPHWKEVPKKVSGWVGKPKGMLQLCYERGLINGFEYSGMDLWRMNVIHSKTSDGPDSDITVKGLADLLDDCSDFKNEKTMLEYIGEKCNIVMVMSPKCHPEIAGEAIEMIWGIAKVRFRRIPLSDRKTGDAFRQQVEKQLSREMIGLRQVRGSFRAHRGFILAYYHLHSEQADVSLGTLDHIETVKEHAGALQYRDIIEKASEYKKHITVSEMIGTTVRDLAFGADSRTNA